MQNNSKLKYNKRVLKTMKTQGKSHHFYSLFLKDKNAKLSKYDIIYGSDAVEIHQKITKCEVLL